MSDSREESPDWLRSFQLYKQQLQQIRVILFQQIHAQITEGNVKISFNGDINNNAAKGDISMKPAVPQVSSSKLPLLLSEKVQRSKALVECEGDSIDLSGDAGAVGRVVVSDDPSKNNEMFLDLKGKLWSIGSKEAVLNDYIQLKPLSNVYEAETMVEGTLEGFSFDSEEEADKAPAQADEQEVATEQPDGKTKGKPDKKSGAARKKGKPAGGKPPKKLKKKPQAAKKGKTKK